MRNIKTGYFKGFSRVAIAERTAEAAPPQWIYFERYVNGIQPRPNNPLATYSELEPQYRPNSSADSFQVPNFQIPKKNVMVLCSSDINPKIFNHYLSNEHASLAVHPQISKDLSVNKMQEIVSHPKASDIVVSPTASSRTVFVLDPHLPPHCLKLHCPIQITRSTRHLEKRKIEHSITVSNALAHSTAMRANPAFAYFPESLGIVYGNAFDSWGFLVRDMTPRPYLPNSSFIPLFSLYSPDVAHPNRPPLLHELIGESGVDPEQCILQQIFFPLLKCWVDVYTNTGILLEAHGQNVCLELSESGQISRFIFRDFDTYVNKDIYTEKHKGSLEGLNPYELFQSKDTEEAPQGTTVSLIYDQAMRVPFDRIAEIAEKTYHIPKQRLQSACRSYLRQIFPEGDLHFPKGGKVFNYAEGALRVGAKAKIVETGQEPTWR
ncbi:MAG: hypothetical protein KGZ39_08315 [Simkania sp.]|nr:hypothetical protein [Simkania sp.]